MTNHASYYHRSLDGFRGFALVLVLLVHTDIFHFGWIGVQLFFVLSGYLITSILIREKEQPTSLKTKFRNFWARRILRIFPLYFFYLLVIVIVWLFFYRRNDLLDKLPYLFTYTYNLYLGLSSHGYSSYPIPQLWSLSIEEQFYLLYPFLVLLCRRNLLKKMAIGVIIFSFGFRLFLNEWMPGHTNFSGYRVMGVIYTMSPSHFDAFMIGGCIVIFQLSKLSIRVKHFIFVSLLCLLLIAGFIVYLDRYPVPFSFKNYIFNLGIANDYGGFKNVVWIYLLLNLVFASIIIILESPVKKGLGKWMDAFFSMKLLVKIGKVSYGMYVMHLALRSLVLLLMPFADRWFLPNFGTSSYRYLMVFIFMPLTYFVALFVYEFYEKKFLLLKDRFRSDPGVKN
jgi:peptidoglycan/LPS O-acetylase OafA/YrhL